MHQKPKMHEQRLQFKPMDHRFEVTVEHAGSSLTASSSRGRESTINDHHCQCHHQCQTSAPQAEIPQPAVSSSPLQDFKRLLDFIHCIFIMLSNKGQFSLSSNPSNQSNSQLRSEEESQRSQSPRDSAEVAAVLQDSQGKSSSHHSGSDQCRSSGMLLQKKSYFKVSFFRNGIKGIFRVIQQIRSRQQSPKSSSKSVPQGHDVYDPAPLSSLTHEKRQSITESRWVMGPHPGSELKGRFCAKGVQASRFKG